MIRFSIVFVFAALLASGATDSTGPTASRSSAAVVGQTNRPVEFAAVEITPVPIHRVAPVYPPELRKAGVTGSVLVDFLVDVRGDVRNALAIRSNNPKLAAAAIRAVEQWTFRPGLVHGEPVVTHMQVPIVFELNEEARTPPAVHRNVPSHEAVYPIGEVSVTPMPRIRIAPKYPRAEREHGMTGEALIEFIVAPDGSVANVHVVHATNGDFGAAALAAIEQWKFKPALRDGHPVNCRMQVPIVFNLRD